ncbi:hypothetical protein JHK85_010280 [Glycine max]|nr:hypothetical protein JHK85_010280 [Glycine max]
MMSDDRYLVCDQHLCRQCGTERTWSSRHSWIFREELHRTTEVGSNKGHKKQNLRKPLLRYLNCLPLLHIVPSLPLLALLLVTGERGNKIIITTRDENVALAMQTFRPIHYLRSFPTEDCRSLLSHHAFGASNNRKQSKLEVIGKEIAKRCGGLPLAAEALGGLLRTKLIEKEWNNVLKSNIWDLPNVKVLLAL